MKVRLVHTAVMCWEISDNCTNVIKFEVRKIMPGLTARGHGRFRMTEGLQIRFLEGGKMSMNVNGINNGAYMMLSSTLGAPSLSYIRQIK